MALSRVGGTSAAATSIAIPTHVAGDLIVIWAYRDGNTTPPTVPTAGGTVPTFTTIDGPTGANTNSAVCAYAVAAGTTDTSGTWTNATGISVEVWRGQSAVPIGGHAQNGAAVASGGNLAMPAITLTDPTGNSIILAFAGWQTVTAWSAAPAGYTQRSQVATEVEALTKDTTTSDGAFNVSGTASGSGGTRRQQVEILAALGNRVSEVAVEALVDPNGPRRVSQVAVEALIVNAPSVGNRVSEVSVEVLLQDQVSPSFISSVTAVYTPTIVDPYVHPSFIASATVVYTPALQGYVSPSFIASVTTVYTPTIQDPYVRPSFIASTTIVYTPTLTASSTDVTPPFIPSVTVVYDPTVTSVEVDPDFIDSVTVVYRPTLRVAFTGGGVSQVALEVTTSDDTADAYVSQITLEIVVPNYKGLHVWQRN